MTGRIKLLKNGIEIKEEDDPEIGYEYDQSGDFDKTCGTFGLDDFTLPQAICPDRFVCNTEEAPVGVQQFATCIDAMNCRMLGGMTTNVASGSETALFMHQMIPHHQNAVNMAKALLHSGSLQCPDITEESEDCILFGMMHEIINGQNFQIQAMQGILEGNDEYLVTDNCDVPFGETPVDSPVDSPTMDPGSDAPTPNDPDTSGSSLAVGLSLACIPAVLAAFLV